MGGHYAGQGGWAQLQSDWVELKSGSGGHLSSRVSASIGLGGIEIGHQAHSYGICVALQSDWVELKSESVLYRGLPVLASIGLGGIEIVFLCKPIRWQRKLQSDWVELKYDKIVAAYNIWQSFNRTGWN